MKKSSFQDSKIQSLVISVSTFIVLDGSFVFSIYTSTQAGKKIVYTPSRGTNREKYFHHWNVKMKMPTLPGKKHLFIQFFP